MIGALRRKAAQLLADPALRRWLMDRALGRVAAPEPMAARRPPYLEGFELGEPQGAIPFAALPPTRPSVPLTLRLAGETVTVAPGEEDTLFQRSFADLETLLSLHRFAWLPLLEGQEDPAWVGALWTAWSKAFGQVRAGWPWHAYTAAERVVNMLGFGCRHGLPEGAASLLLAHGPAIVAGLEYFGEAHTYNHLANNGRGLYLLGLAAGWEDCAEAGRRILLGEALRLFLPSGVLREESSHYQWLYLRNYAQVWAAARRLGRPEAPELEAVLRPVLAVAKAMMLPGGLPLVGDISPDCPPAYLTGGGWLATLPAEDRQAFTALYDSLPAAPLGDGWLRADHGDWAGLWHAALDGWPFMPGHGHHDLGSAELHWRGHPVFIDPGRGAYGESGEAALYRSAAVHGLLQVDGADPTPANRPYYDNSFRSRIGGAAPSLRADPGGVILSHHGFRAQGVGRVERRWTFSAGLVLSDRVEGRGSHDITRRLVTPWPVEQADGVVLVSTPAGRLRVTAEVPLAVRPLKRWTAYGEGAPAMAIEASVRSSLPWQGTIVVEEG